MAKNKVAKDQLWDAQQDTKRRIDILKNQIKPRLNTLIDEYAYYKKHEELSTNPHEQDEYWRLGKEISDKFPMLLQDEGLSNALVKAEERILEERARFKREHDERQERERLKSVITEEEKSQKEREQNNLNSLRKFQLPPNSKSKTKKRGIFGWGKYRTKFRKARKPKRKTGRKRYN